MRSLSRTLTPHALLALIALSLGTLALWGVRAPAAPTAPPPLVYGVLTKFGRGDGRVGGFDSADWEFSNGVETLNETALRTKLGMKPGVPANDAAFVNGLADLGWDLVSHSERSGMPSFSINNGSGSSNPSIYVEHWWFKRR